MLPSNRHFVCKIQSKCIDEKFFLASQSALSANSFTGGGENNGRELHKSSPAGPRRPPPAVRLGLGGGAGAPQDRGCREAAPVAQTSPARSPVSDCYRGLLGFFCLFVCSSPLRPRFYEHGNE